MLTSHMTASEKSLKKNAKTFASVWNTRYICGAIERGTFESN